MKKLRTAIIGIGKVTPLHARALQKSPQSKFVAVCSRSLAKAQQFAHQYEVNAYDDLSTMLENEKVEVLVVCTPHPYHAESACLAAAKGIHLLIEKPLAHNLADADAIISACEAHAVTCGVVSQRRFFPAVKRMKAAIDAGKIGKPALATVQIYGWRGREYYESDPWRGKWLTEGGGVLVNQAPHQLDIFQWLMGPIVEVFGCWQNINHPYIEVEDTALAVVKFADGGLGNLVLSNSQKPGIYGKVHVHGENGASIGVQTDGGAMFIAGMSEIEEVPYNDIWTIPGEENLPERWQKQDEEVFKKENATDYFHQLQVNEFLAAVKDNKKPLIDAGEGRKTVEIFTAIYRSQRDNSPISFPLKPEDDNNLDGRLPDR